MSRLLKEFFHNVPRLMLFLQIQNPDYHIAGWTDEDRSLIGVCLYLRIEKHIRQSASCACLLACAERLET